MIKNAPLVGAFLVVKSKKYSGLHVSYAIENKKKVSKTGGVGNNIYLIKSPIAKRNNP